MLAWWEHAPESERQLVDAIPTVQRVTRGIGVLGARLEPVRDALLETLFASGSDLVILPIQDLFGWSERINTPATVAESNWIFRLPWPSDRLDEVAEARERQSRLRAWAEEYHRVE
jgi:4-alpha-glucanotransferase